MRNNRAHFEELHSTNEGDGFYPRGDNSKRVKIHWRFLTSSPEPAGQSQSNLIQIILG
jgi:hypothetical protein